MNTKIPDQVEGGFSDTFSEEVFETISEVFFHFGNVKKRFFDVNSWYVFTEKKGAEFFLCNSDGDIIFTKPIVGNYIKIKIPLLYNPTGKLFDWVKIELIEEEKTENREIIYIRARPSEDPQKKDGKIAHFFKNKATSNFLIKREGNKITAEVHGRNEIPNTEDLTLLEKTRNFLVSINAIAIGSKIEWKSLTQALVKKDEK
jgi:hypothetical protein